MTARRALATLFLLAGLAGCGSVVAPRGSDAPSPSAAPTTSANATATTPASSPASVLGLAVVAVDDLILREGPGTNEPIQTVGPGIPTSGDPIRVSVRQRVWVIDTREVEGQSWYQVVIELGFTPGWTTGGSATDPSITTFDLATCPPSAADDLVSQALDPGPMRSLACFGREQIALDVYWPTPEQTAVDVPCPWGPPQWLLCYEYVNLTGDGTRSVAVYGTTELGAFPRGQWVTLVGHYDDPRSPDCAIPSEPNQAAASVLFCRTRFVAERVGWVGP